jgi:hypothetical protein
MRYYRQKFAFHRAPPETGRAWSGRWGVRRSVVKSDPRFYEAFLRGKHDAIFNIPERPVQSEHNPPVRAAQSAGASVKTSMAKISTTLRSFEALRKWLPRLDLAISRPGRSSRGAASKLHRRSAGLLQSALEKAVRQTPSQPPGFYLEKGGRHRCNSRIFCFRFAALRLTSS